MALTVEKLAIPDVLLIRPKKFGDARGYFAETYNARAYCEAGIDCVFVQDNQSLSVEKGTIRGLHFQVPPEPQAKLVRVLRGAILDVAVDLRRGSPHYGQWCGATLTAEEGEQLFVPRGFAHGFCTLMPETEVAYKVDGFYAPGCDAGLRYDDPDINIPWPLDGKAAMISDKDGKLPFLRDFKSPFTFEVPA
ncbi:dTDP-4-dehydrorhamnose 3,5-epimerase [Beijerinckia indica]|uniref:dTDP-4-dehydrorhamnose 3,5-epimerase n=1 Tax=Beijerinckia indica subsp. indica (strain ATCC 9039 / DSM 1715 / NCIMB 8712) TaxID=395963 RepID=B2IFG0_BEII9|nr:dTDP-4-dehydrorhamnose 3,5-epimerase [Beijerinckia indica]ACB97060.1 dTDP-4-dehydrorhamnose 3,5-epimerase [Beijerinckia indica subsp. indica ATCC 9039]